MPRHRYLLVVSASYLNQPLKQPVSSSRCAAASTSTLALDAVISIVAYMYRRHFVAAFASVPVRRHTQTREVGQWKTSNGC